MTYNIQMINSAIEYLESIVVPTKDLGYIYCAICILNKELEERSNVDDKTGTITTILAE